MKLLDDTQGSIREAMIILTPQTKIVFPSVMKALGDVPVKVPYHATQEHVAENLFNTMEALGKHKPSVAQHIMGLDDPSSLVLFTTARKQTLLIPNSDSVLDQISAQYCSDHIVRAAVHAIIDHVVVNSVYHSLSDDDIRSFQETYKNAVFLDTKKRITGWARDICFPGTDDDGAVLLQGGVLPNSAFYRYEQIRNTVAIPLRRWFRNYKRIPNSDSPLQNIEHGDIRCAGETLFVGLYTFEANSEYTNDGIEGRLRELSGCTRVVRVGTVADHIDHFFVPFTEGEVGVGDFTPVAVYLQKNGLYGREEERSYKCLQPKLDQAANELQEQGFSVDRFPLYAEFTDGDYRSTILNCRCPANEIRHGKKSMFASFGVDELDELTYETFTAHNIEPQPVFFGTFHQIMRDPAYFSLTRGGLRCYVNVLQRS